MTIQVKYLSEEAIEKDAEALLAEFASGRCVSLQPPIPIEDIVEKHLKLHVEFDDLHNVLDIPQEGPEPDILGAIWVDRREIYIDQRLDPEERPSMEGRYRFTLAHEGGGHWRLHRAYLVNDPNQASLFGHNTQPAVICRSSQSKERVELQADMYAACLLMPRGMVFDIWRGRFGGLNPLVFEECRQTMKIDPPRWSQPRRFGEMAGDTEYDNFADGWSDYFAQMFQVSRQAMRIRLETLGLLCRKNPRQMSFA